MNPNAPVFVPKVNNNIGINQASVITSPTPVAVVPEDNWEKKSRSIRYNYNY